MKKFIILLSACSLLVSCHNAEKQRKEKIVQLITAAYADNLEYGTKASPVTVMSMEGLTERGLITISMAVLEKEVKEIDSLFETPKKLAAEGLDTTRITFSDARFDVFRNEQQADKHILDSLHSVSTNASDKDIYSWKVEAALIFKGEAKPDIQFTDFFITKDDKVHPLIPSEIRILCKDVKH